MKRIILHHSLTADSNTKSFDAIKKYHIETKGWNDIGYHEVIEVVNGGVTHFEGRSRDTTGAHTLGQNTGTLGICLVGNFDLAPPSAEMMAYLYKRLDFYRGLYGSIKIEGHCDWSTKTCPGTKFPLAEVKAYFDVKPKHWAKDNFYFYNKYIGTMLEERLDDNLTRGEYVTLKVNEYKKEKGL